MKTACKRVQNRQCIKLCTREVLRNCALQIDIYLLTYLLYLMLCCVIVIELKKQTPGLLAQKIRGAET